MDKHVCSWSLAQRKTNKKSIFAADRRVAEAAQILCVNQEFLIYYLKITNIILLILYWFLIAGLKDSQCNFDLEHITSSKLSLRDLMLLCFNF